MLQNNNNINFDQVEGEEVNIRQIIEKYLYYWKWFVLALVIALVGAFLYLRYTTKTYSASAQIILSGKGGNNNVLAAFSDAGAALTADTNPEVYDQIKILKSRSLMYQTVAATNLNIRYFAKGQVKEVEFLAHNSPVQIVFANDSITKAADFSGSLELDVLNAKQFKIQESSFLPTGTYPFNTAIPSKFGPIRLVSNNGNEEAKGQIKIQFVPIMAAADAFRGKLQIEPEKDKSSMIVNFYMVDAVKERAVLLINKVIEMYNLRSKENDSKLADATAQFINERLKLISSDLANVDKNLKVFKASNKVNNIDSQASTFLEDATSVDNSVIEYNLQLEIAQQLTHSLTKNKNALLPSSMGIKDVSLNALIGQYNQLVLEKQSLQNAMRENNPAMESLNANIADVRENILNSLTLYKNNLKISLNFIENKRKNLNAKLDKLPEQERGFRDIVRQQQIVESIYLYLLQKREEAEIKAAATADMVTVIDDAYANNAPVNPNAKMILLAALVLGLIIPFTVIFIRFLLDNKIKDKSDFAGIYNGPYLGDVPKSKNRFITNNDRSSLAEGMRIIRSNLKFILPKNNESKVIYVTSTISGEGKTFFAVNMAQLLGLTNKKVVLLGADIRKPRILKYLNLERTLMPGLSNYLINEELTLDDIVFKKPNDLLLDVIPAGSIPPNPAELLMDPRYGELIELLKTEYDYVIVDTAPIGLVTDTQIISQYADATVFIARSNYLDKRLTKIVQEMYNQNKLVNLGLVINDVDYSRSFGYGYGYGNDHDFTKKKKKSLN